jgi:predicted cupin superfamily sugar epimerase
MSFMQRTIPGISRNMKITAIFFLLRRGEVSMFHLADDIAAEKCDVF